ncbi:glycosyl transferase [Candidatus Vecturithrix granuli]|uniref:Glycosyl transferase n=1 Tax=Vecturithrix granuli TaxID=1499967 RepID=A0A081C1F9_VECG1|nr:glycosyl transferase [Candidatus Vecturithrix granuli]
MNTPSVIFSVGVGIPGEGMGNHAYHLIQGLERHHLLLRGFVMQVRKNGNALPSIHATYFIEKMAYRLARYTGINQYVLRDNGFDWWVARQLHAATIFYGWTHHALWSLKKAKKLKMLTVLERANAHPLTYSRLLEAEYRKYGLTDRPYHPLILKKHLQELEVADYIAVTSQFTKQSLLEHGIDEQRILLTPLGVDVEHFTPDMPAKLQFRGTDETFRVLYVGQLCLRKGVQYLLEAWHTLQLKYAKLVLVGDLLPEFKNILHDALACDQGRTIRVAAHVDDPVALYQQASVCILPTLEDGFGLVVLEAMACGVPVIITEHTGAKDCVRHGLDGFIIPPYCSESIAETLTYCYDHREQLHTMGVQARQQACHFPWRCYQDGIAHHLHAITT